MRWTRVNDAVLRTLWGTLTNAEIGRRVGGTAGAVKCRARKLRLPRLRRPWTDAEDDRLRALYPTHTAEQCAIAIGRSLCSTTQRIDTLNLSKHPRWPAEVVERARRLNADGCPDRVIAERMADVFAPGETGQYQAKQLRKTHGWPFRPDREAKQRAVASQRKTLGVRHGGDLRALGYRRYAERAGWPTDLPPRAVQILNVLATSGPKTAMQLAAAIGMPTDKQNVVHGGPRLLACSAHSALCKGHGTYTGLLIARGLVVAVRRSGGPGAGKGGARRPDLYTLTPHAVRVRQEILDGQAQATGGETERDHDAGRRGAADARARRHR